MSMNYISLGDQMKEAFFRLKCIKEFYTLFKATGSLNSYK